MKPEIISDAINRQEWLGTASDVIQPAIIKAFEAGGETGQQLKNFLHGTWLGHPLHPVITDVPIGAWTAAAVLDCLELSGQRKYAPGADAAIAIGLVGALGAAVTGFTDWTGTTKKKRKIGLLHAFLNIGATALYTTSYILRRRQDSRRPAIGLALVGYGVVSASAYLGGHLVYAEGVGVDHRATSAENPEEFGAALPEGELTDTTM
jgi:uncharacterized membrane protein